jgi:hypothetical protein
VYVMINSGRSDLGACVLSQDLKDGVASQALSGAWVRFRDEPKLEKGPMAVLLAMPMKKTQPTQLPSLLVRVSYRPVASRVGILY